jgi:hypothetical protein
MNKMTRGMLDAMNVELGVHRQFQRCSYAPLVKNASHRKLLSEWSRNSVDLAKAGDPKAARRILQDFVRSIRQHSKRSWAGPNHIVYARYLANAIEQILNGQDASIALGIKSSRPGRRKGTRTHNPRALAAGFWLLRRMGLPTEQCASFIQNLTGADRTTVQSARKARGTKAFGRSDLVNVNELKSIVAKQPFGITLLKHLRSLSSK